MFLSQYFVGEVVPAFYRLEKNVIFPKIALKALYIYLPNLARAQMRSNIKKRGCCFWSLISSLMLTINQRFFLFLRKETNIFRLMYHNTYYKSVLKNMIPYDEHLMSMTSFKIFKKTCLKMYYTLSGNQPFPGDYN